MTEFGLILCVLMWPIFYFVGYLRGRQVGADKVMRRWEAVLAVISRERGRWKTGLSSFLNL